MKTPKGFLVCAERCHQCLFGPNKIVSEARKRELLKELERKDAYFECHIHTIAKRHVCCKGDYDRDPARTNLMRIAGRLGVVVYVDESGKKVA